ncbi:MAG TPA: alpha/beta hydrolase, partial [Chroococcales cyanobacterium]
QDTAAMQVAQLEAKLKFAQTSNIVKAVAAPDKVEKRAFISHFDGTEDFIAVEPTALPTGTRKVTLFVYLHGMGGTCLEPFTTPQNAPISEFLMRKDHSYVLMAPNYRAPAGWVSDAVLADITQNIRMMCQQYPVDRIFLIGSSMGGCVSLSYSALAPEDIKKKLCGVVAIDAAGNLAELYHKTKLDSVRATMNVCFGGPPERVPVAYAAKSLMPNISGVPGSVRLAIISGRQDKTVPPEFQDEVFNAFKSQGRPSKLIPVDMDHGMPPQSVVMEAVDFVVGDTKDGSDK